MAVYVSQTEDDQRGNNLRLVRCGTEHRLLFDDVRKGTVKVHSTTPEWAIQIARNHGYTPVDANTGRALRE